MFGRRPADSFCLASLSEIHHGNEFLIIGLQFLGARLIARLIFAIAGGLMLAIGFGWTWALYFPSRPSDSILLGSMLIPLAWIGCMLWLWFSDWRQRWIRLIVPAALLWSAIAWRFYLG